MVGTQYIPHRKKLEKQMLHRRFVHRNHERSKVQLNLQLNLQRKQHQIQITSLVVLPHHLRVVEVVTK